MAQHGSLITQAMPPFAPNRPDLIAMNRALHHVWEAGGATFIGRLRDNLRPGGAAVI